MSTILVAFLLSITSSLPSVPFCDTFSSSTNNNWPTNSGSITWSTTTTSCDLTNRPCISLSDVANIQSISIDASNYKSLYLTFDIDLEDYEPDDDIIIRATFNDFSTKTVLATYSGDAYDSQVPSEIKHNEQLPLPDSFNYQSSIRLEFEAKPSASETVFLDNICLYGFTDSPTKYPTIIPTITPTFIPTNTPTINPTIVPTHIPTINPTNIPTNIPTIPTNIPTFIPTNMPTNIPTNNPTGIPTTLPSYNPVTQIPTTAIPTTSPVKDGIVATESNNIEQTVGGQLLTDQGSFFTNEIVLILFSIILLLLIIAAMICVFIFISRRKIRKTKNNIQIIKGDLNSDFVGAIKSDIEIVNTNTPNILHSTSANNNSDKDIADELYGTRIETKRQNNNDMEYDTEEGSESLYKETQTTAGVLSQDGTTGK